MGSTSSPAKPLSADQRRLVEQNIGLVAVHIRRFVRGLAQPRRDREWDDLFQEGCLGLMRAAAIYRAESGIDFAAFALARVHGAIHKALHTRFATIAVPPAMVRASTSAPPDSAAPARKADAAPTDHERTSSGDGHVLSAPKVRSLGVSVAWPGADAAGHERLLHRLDAGPESASHHHSIMGRESIGERMRDKYIRAVEAAAAIVARGAATRSDRDALVRAIVEQRLRIANPEYRTPVRRLARETDSSCARVSQCERRIRDHARAILERDPELPLLVRRARTDPAGGSALIDRRFEAELAGAGAARFVASLADPTAEHRLVRLNALVDRARPELAALVAARFAKLTAEEREEWLRGCDADRVGRAADPARSRRGGESKKRRDPCEGLRPDAAHRVEVRG